MTEVKFISMVEELGKSKSCSDGRHLRFNCPYCPEVRGKADDDYKLYFNKHKSVGMCFKCATVVVLESDEEIPSLESIKEHFESMFGFLFAPPKREFEVPEFDISFSVPAFEDKDVMNYLRGRNHPLSDELIVYWDLRACILKGKKYVLIPNKVVGNKTDYYQMRIASKDAPKNERWNSPNTSIKPLFKIHKFKWDDLVLVEGVFSATAVGANAVPLLGKYLTDRQQRQLLARFSTFGFPKRVFIVLDGGALEKKLANKIYYKLREMFITTTDIYKINLPYGKDPDEVDNIMDYEIVLLNDIKKIGTNK
jgi:hypothetical protein